MKKIVLTGGPSAGKTSFITELKRIHQNDKHVFFAPEVASMLLGNDFPRCSEESNLIFQQRAIFNTQREMEELLTAEKKYAVSFFDRGLLDAWAYITEDKQRELGEKKLILGNYEAIIQLEVAPEKKYTKQNNKARTESYEEALNLQNKLKNLWSGHKNYIFVSSELSFEEKFKKAYEQQIKPLIES